MTAETAVSPILPDAAERLLRLLAVAALLTAVVVAFTLPLGDGYDERAHLAYVRAMAEAPSLFPDHARLRLLDAAGIGWSAEPNYLSHPPLYYLLTAPLAALFPGTALPIRLLDAALAVAGLVLAGSGGLARLVDARARILYVAMLFGLPTMIGVAGLINNDDLAIAEIGGLIFVLGRGIRAPIAVALLVAALGFTKLTGYVAAAGFLVLLAVLDRDTMRRRDLPIVAAGLLVGALPSLVQLAVTGSPIWTPAAFPDWFDIVAPAERAAMGIGDFARLYLDHIGRRLPYRADTLPGTPLLVAIALAVATALLPGAGDRRGRRWPIAAALTVAVYGALHFGYAWSSFVGRGSIVELQPRYLGVVWPFAAFAVATGIAGLPGRLRDVAVAAMLVGIVAISVLGAAVVRLAGLL